MNQSQIIPKIKKLVKANDFDAAHQLALEINNIKVCVKVYFLISESETNCKK